MKYPSVEDSLSSMQIIVDTREQNTSSFRRRTALFPCGYVREKLDFGDYSVQCVLPDGKPFSLKNKVAIERKMSLDELSSNLTTERKRFEREFERMKNSGGKVYLLVEGASWSRILNGDYRSRFSPNAYLGSLLSYSARYNLHIVFVPEGISPNLIYNILKYELREALMNYEEEDANE